jgi:hypothetical protein
LVRKLKHPIAPVIGGIQGKGASVRFGIGRKALSLLAGGIGVIAAVMSAAPSAAADPDVPVPAPPAPIEASAGDAAAPAPPPVDPLAFLHPAPPPAAPAEVAAEPAPAPPPVDPLAFLHPAPPPAAPAEVAAEPAAAPLPTLPDGVPHLASPDALPPGSTMDPTTQGNEDPNVSYLKDLWHAVQNQEISGKEALLMGLAQRGMNTPYPQQAAGPNVPISGAELAPAAPPPGDAPPPPPPADAPPPAPAPSLPWLPSPPPAA